MNVSPNTFTMAVDLFGVGKILAASYYLSFFRNICFTKKNTSCRQTPMPGLYWIYSIYLHINLIETILYLHKQRRQVETRLSTVLLIQACFLTLMLPGTPVSPIFNEMLGRVGPVGPSKTFFYFFS